MLETDSNKRLSDRIVPKRPIFVAMEGAGSPVARGLVSNISQGGACVALAGPFDIGDQVVLRLSFAQQPQPISAAGRVVWSRAAPRGGARFGVTWTDDGPGRRQLGSLILANHTPGP